MADHQREFFSQADRRSQLRLSFNDSSPSNNFTRSTTFPPSEIILNNGNGEEPRERRRTSHPHSRWMPPATGFEMETSSVSRTDHHGAYVECVVKLDSPKKSVNRERFPIGRFPNMHSTGKLQVSPTSVYDFTSDDLCDMGEIGRGGFGTVNKMLHRKSQKVMAVKRIRSTVDEKEQKQLLMDLEVVMKSNDCPYIVQFYGALFKEGDCWICMELMDTSLDKFYKFIFEQMKQTIPELFLGKITVSTVRALNYLKENLKIIHRDVKPSNILLDRRENIKLCDFGISGQLVDSIAKTRDAGCRPYMAPERIDPGKAKVGYDVRSDVWSLGITLMEVATGKFPYPKWNSVFDQLYQVVHGNPPRLTSEMGLHFSSPFISFVNTCLTKDENKRPKYKQLLEHPFIQLSDKMDNDKSQYVCKVLDYMIERGANMFTTDLP